MAYDPTLKVPKRVFMNDPAGRKAEDDSAQYWKKEAQAARSKREFMEEKQMTERIIHPEAPPEPAFVVKGSVNLGNIDYQQQQRDAADAAERQRLDAADRVSKAEKERDDARKSLGEAQFSHLKVELGNKIDELQKSVTSNSKPLDFPDQLAGIMKLAGLLGFEKPVAGPTDSALSLEIKKLEWAMKKEDRDFQRLMKKDEREWQIELRRLDQQSREADGRVKAEKEKFQAFANIPERLGAVVVQGLADRANGEPQPESQPQSQPQSKIRPSANPNFHIEARIGEAGEVACPNPECGSPIGIAPNSPSAECVNCHTKITINRIEGTPAPVTEEKRSDFIT